MYNNNSSNECEYSIIEIPIHETVSNRDIRVISQQQQRIFVQMCNMGIELKKNINYHKNDVFPKTGILKMKANSNDVFELVKNLAKSLKGELMIYSPSVISCERFLSYKLITFLRTHSAQNNFKTRIIIPEENLLTLSKKLRYLILKLGGLVRSSDESSFLLRSLLLSNQMTSNPDYFMVIVDNLHLLVLDKPNIDAITKQIAKAEISYFCKYYSDIDNIRKFRNVFNLLWDKSFFI